MRIPMVVAAFVATDTRVLREAATFAVAGHKVHIIGKSLPSDFSTISTLPAGKLAPSGSRYGRCPPRHRSSWPRVLVDCGAPRGGSSASLVIGMPVANSLLPVAGIARRFLIPFRSLYRGFAPQAPTRYGSNRAVRANQ